MAVLWVFDDGGKAAELVRIRGSHFVIGRTQGDLTIPHDAQISARHAEIVLTAEGSRYRWCLRDLGSTNGTFVRARAAALKDESEILIVRHRLRLSAAPQGRAGCRRAAAGCQHPPDVQLAVADVEPGTAVEELAGPPPRPQLLELLPSGEGRCFPLTADSQWIGRDPQQCAIVLDDPTVDPRHARIFRDGQGRWHIEDAPSLNGIWLRVSEVPLCSQAAFLLGEQVFAVTLP